MPYGSPRAASPNNDPFNMPTYADVPTNDVMNMLEITVRSETNLPNALHALLDGFQPNAWRWFVLRHWRDELDAPASAAMHALIAVLTSPTEAGGAGPFYHSPGARRMLVECMRHANRLGPLP